MTQNEARQAVFPRHPRRLGDSLAFLERVTPAHDAIVLDYPWGDPNGVAGALLGFIPEHVDEPGAYIEVWRQADAA